MKKRKVIGLILGFIVSVLIIFGVTNLSFGVQSGWEFKTKGHIFNPNKGGGPLSTSVGTVYCAEEGGELKSYDDDGKEITHYYYESGTGSIAKKLAYAISFADSASKQRIIWNSNLSDNIGDPPGLNSEERRLVNEGKNYVNAVDDKTTLESNPDEAKSATMNGKSYYKIGPIKVDFSSLGTDGSIDNIKVYSEDGTYIEEITSAIDRDGNSKALSLVNSNQSFYILLLKENYKNIKNVKLEIHTLGLAYGGTYTKYTPKIYYDSDNSKLSGVNGQDLIHVNTTHRTVRDKVSFTVKLGEPRLVVTKYIKRIQHEGKTDSYYSAPNSWDTSEWGITSKPIISVDLNADVNSSSRYNLQKQDISKINVTKGDVITYVIRVYNVGDGEADFTTDKYSANSKNSADNKYLEDNVIYDYMGSGLEFIDGKDPYAEINPDKETTWTKKGDAYVVDLSNKDENGTKLQRNGVLKECDGDISNIDDWSGYVQIRCRVTGEQGQTMSLTNNDSKVERKDTYRKFLYSIESKDASGEYKTYKMNEPIATVNTNVSVNSSNRFNYNLNASDPTIMNGDKLTYCIRYYSIGANSTKLTYKVEDTVGEGIKYVQGSAKNQSGTLIPIIQSGSKITIPAQNVELEGCTNGNKVPYFDVYLTFEVKFDDAAKIAYVSNTASNTVNTILGYEVKGKVFIDKKDTESGKTTKAGDAINGTGDKPAEGVKVELIDAETGNLAEIKDAATGVVYNNTTYTDSSGNYSFTHIRSRELELDPKTGEIIGYKDVSKPYYIRFTYNGQMYENVKYNAEGKTAYEGNGSFATEGGNVLSTDLTRESFNTKFTEIYGESSNNTSKNSTDYSLKNNNNELDEEKSKVSYVQNGYAITAYTGNNGYGTGTQITVDTASSQNNKSVNLGLVEREFNLMISSKLISMDEHINGENTTLNPKHGTIQDKINASDLAYEGAYFKASDYNYVGSNELSIDVNYQVTISNISADNFIGVLNNINLFCDSRYQDNIVVKDTNGNLYTATKTGTVSKDSNISFDVYKIDLNGSQIYRDANSNGGTNELNLIVSLTLDRETIKNAIEASDSVMTSFETLAEIASYGSKYNGDIYNNGHGTNNVNAGKIDSNSNSGNFEGNRMQIYVNQIREINNAEEKVNAVNNLIGGQEDDETMALGIRLYKDENERTLKGKVFEDNTEHKQDNTRLGNGSYENGEKAISGVTVELQENGETVDFASANGGKLMTSKVTTAEDGTYEFKGFIPSYNYTIKFTYGNGNTYIYNAQDYKSTVDTTGNSFENAKAQTIVDEKGDTKQNTPIGASNYWYRNGITNKSVAKDDNVKMTSDQLTNEKAKILEDYTKVTENPDIFKNHATTATFCVPVKKDGNTEFIAEEYIIPDMNLGLAERPRSELTINKLVDHVTITAADGTMLIDGSNKVNSVSWTDRYVQPIVDENLIYGSTLKITYKYTITNTGEIDYAASGDVQYNSNGIIKDTSRKFYDFGEKRSDNDLIKTNADTIIDYTDNNLLYDETMNVASYISGIESDKNEKYWTISSGDESYLDNDTKAYYNETNTKLKIEGKEINTAVKPGETTKPVYLTLSKVLSASNQEELLTYNNYIEIIKSTNEAGRRSYHTIDTRVEDKSIPDTTTTQNGTYTITAGYNTIPLSDIDNSIRIAPEVGNKMKTTPNGKYLILSIPGNIGKPTTQTTTLGWEPDSDSAEEIQIIPPFGDTKKANTKTWIVLGTISAIILAGGIYIIKKKIL